MRGRTILSISIITVVIGAGIIVNVILSSRSPEAYQAVAKPTFQTLLPKDVSVKSLGGWSQLNPPGNAPVYAYVDEIDGIAIKVSQQRLPDAFKKDTKAQMAKLASDYHATTKLQVGDTTVYIGKNARGPQSVIFAQNDLLISITSDNTISDSAWAAYVKSLK